MIPHLSLSWEEFVFLPGQQGLMRLSCLFLSVACLRQAFLTSVLPAARLRQLFWFFFRRML
jgi:hypothetical protein